MAVVHFVENTTGQHVKRIDTDEVSTASSQQVELIFVIIMCRSRMVLLYCLRQTTSGWQPVEAVKLAGSVGCAVSGCAALRGGLLISEPQP